MRALYSAVLVAVVIAGYWLRFHAPIPEWMRDNSGGALYVVAVALSLALLAPRAEPRRIAVYALAVTCAVEFLQAWRAGWLVALRQTLPGRLVLGSTFRWGDFPAYFVGALLAWAVLATLNRRSAARSRSAPSSS